MLLLVDCSSCHTPLHLPPGATRIRCAICHAFTLIAPEPRFLSHAPVNPLPFPNSSPTTPAPSPYIYPPPAPSPFNHAPPASSPYNHASHAHSPFTHAPSPFNHAPSGPPPPVHGQKRAVIVGVSYKNTKNELKGCINDAKCMKFMLMKRFQFPESCILMLTGIILYTFQIHVFMILYHARKKSSLKYEISQLVLKCCRRRSGPIEMANEEQHNNGDALASSKLQTGRFPSLPFLRSRQQPNGLQRRRG